MSVVNELRAIRKTAAVRAEMERRGHLGYYEATVDGAPVKVFQRSNGEFIEAKIPRKREKVVRRNPRATRKPTVASMKSRKARRTWISSKIRTLREEKYPEGQAIAVAYAEMRRALEQAGRRVPADIRSPASAAGRTRKNPRKDHLTYAIDLYTGFREEKPEFTEAWVLPEHDAGAVMGHCFGLMYETTIDGRQQRFMHQFEADAAPMLVASWDGEQLYLLGGAYKVGPRGIEDKRG